MKKEKDLNKTAISLFSVQGEKLTKYRMVTIQENDLEVRLTNQKWSAQISVYSGQKGYQVKTGFSLTVTFTAEEFERLNNGEVIFKEITHSHPDRGTKVIREHYYSNSVEALVKKFPERFDQNQIDYIKGGRIISTQRE